MFDACRNVYYHGETIDFLAGLIMAVTSYRCEKTILNIEFK